MFLTVNGENVDIITAGTIIQTIYTKYLLVTLVIIILGLLLSKWEPPIKKQNQFLILAVVSMVLSYFVVDSSAISLMYGFVVAGLCFYKGAFADELKAVKEIIARNNQDEAN